MEVKMSYNGGDKWHHKTHGVIYVEKEEHIDELFDLLFTQDEYWENHKDIIQVWTPLKTWKQVEADTLWTGKTDIYDVEWVRKIIPFIFFQFKDGEVIQSNH